LKDFLGQQVYEQLQNVSSDTENVLNKLDLLAKLLGQLLTSDVPIEPDSSHIVSIIADRDEMEVEDLSKERVQSATPFDWKMFLHQRALLPEELSARYAPSFSRIFGDNPRVILRRSLELMHIPEEYIQRILIAVGSLDSDTKTKG